MPCVGREALVIRWYVPLRATNYAVFGADLIALSRADLSVCTGRKCHPGLVFRVYRDAQRW